MLFEKLADDTLKPDFAIWPGEQYLAEISYRKIYANYPGSYETGISTWVLGEFSVDSPVVWSLEKATPIHGQW